MLGPGESCPRDPRAPAKLCFWPFVDHEVSAYCKRSADSTDFACNKVVALSEKLVLKIKIMLKLVLDTKLA